MCLMVGSQGKLLTNQLLKNMTILYHAANTKWENLIMQLIRNPKNWRTMKVVLYIKMSSGLWCHLWNEPPFNYFHVEMVFVSPLMRQYFYKSYNYIRLILYFNINSTRWDFCILQVSLFINFWVPWMVKLQEPLFRWDNSQYQRIYCYSMT